MAGVSFRASQGANKRKTYLLLASMGALVWLVVYAALTYFGKSTTAIVPIAVGIALISVWGSYYTSDSIVLRMTGAREIQQGDNPNLFNLIQEVTIASGLPMPKVAIVQDTAPNAFATGRNPEHAVIAFTTGILDVMDRDARRMRGARPFLFSNLKENKGVDDVAAFIVRQGGLPARPAR